MLSYTDSSRVFCFSAYSCTCTLHCIYIVHVHVVRAALPRQQDDVAVLENSWFR